MPRPRASSKRPETANSRRRAASNSAAARAQIRAHPVPRPFSRRDLAVTVIIATIVTAMFVTLNVFYNADGGVRLGGPGAAADESTAGLVVIIDPEELNPTLRQMGININVAANGADITNPDRTLREQITLEVITTESSNEIELAADELARGRVVYAPIKGEYANYPFDRYQTEVFVRAKEAATGQPVPVYLTANDGIYNWVSEINLPINPTVSRIPGLEGEGLILLDVKRSTTLKVFLGLIAVMVVAVTTTALYLAGMIFTFRRVANAALLAWMTTALFSFLVLRTALPGAPPLGAAIDVFLFFWAILGLMVSVVMVAIGWSRGQKALLLEDVAVRK